MTEPATRTNPGNLHFRMRLAAAHPATGGLPAALAAPVPPDGSRRAPRPTGLTAAIRQLFPRFRSPSPPLHCSRPHKAAAAPLALPHSPGPHDRSLGASSRLGLPWDLTSRGPRSALAPDDKPRGCSGLKSTTSSSPARGFGFFTPHSRDLRPLSLTVRSLLGIYPAFTTR